MPKNGRNIIFSFLTQIVDDGFKMELAEAAVKSHLLTLSPNKVRESS